MSFLSILRVPLGPAPQLPVPGPLQLVLAGCICPAFIPVAMCPPPGAGTPAPPEHQTSGTRSGIQHLGLGRPACAACGPLSAAHILPISIPAPGALGPGTLDAEHPPPSTPGPPACLEGAAPLSALARGPGVEAYSREAGAEGRRMGRGDSGRRWGVARRHCWVVFWTCSSPPPPFLQLPQAAGMMPFDETSPSVRQPHAALAFLP